jgi:hypothetical protein
LGPRCRVRQRPAHEILDDAGVIGGGESRYHLPPRFHGLFLHLDLGYGLLRLEIVLARILLLTQVARGLRRGLSLLEL